MEYTISSLEQLKQLATLLAHLAEPNDVFLLTGDLGAGKTTFSQYFGSALGVTKTINSPTFNIIKSYQGRLPFHHMDCYRLEDGGEDLGFDDYFFDNGVTVVEWPQMIEEYLPDSYMKINLKYIDETTRLMNLQSVGERYRKLLEEFNHEAAAY